MTINRRDLLASAIALPSLLAAAATPVSKPDLADWVIPYGGDPRLTPGVGWDPVWKAWKHFGPDADYFVLRPGENDPRITVLDGGVRSGRMWAVIAKMILLSNYRCGGIRVLSGCSLEWLKLDMLNTMQDLVGPDHFQFNQQTGELIFCGAKWLLLGAGSPEEPTFAEKVIRGARVGLAVVDEATSVPVPFLKALLARMVGEDARLYLATTSGEPDHYIKTDLIDNEHLRESGLLRQLTWTIDGNTALDPAYVQTMKHVLRGNGYERTILGKWVHVDYDS